MSHSANTFDEFMKQRKQASDAFVNGDFDSLEKVSTHASPATIFGPKGDCIVGADSVNAANANGARQFKPGGENAFDVLHKAADGNLAYWVGIQRSVVKMEGQSHGIAMDLRVTELFRRENGSWKLFHRHADRLNSAAEK